MNSWIELGVLCRAHGVRGAVRLRLFNPDSFVVSSLKDVYLVPKERGKKNTSTVANKQHSSSINKYQSALSSISDYMPMVISQAKYVGEADWLVHFESITAREAAQALSGFVMVANRQDLPSLQEGEYYLSDLVGCKVYGPTKDHLGEVVSVQNYGAQDLLVVRFLSTNEERLIPLVEDFVSLVDIKDSRVELVSFGEVD